MTQQQEANNDEPKPMKIEIFTGTWYIKLLPIILATNSIGLVSLSLI